MRESVAVARMRWSSSKSLVYDGCRSFNQNVLAINTRHHTDHVATKTHLASALAAAIYGILNDMNPSRFMVESENRVWR